jgi:dTDP-glucose pyrophosphorylase
MFPDLEKICVSPYVTIRQALHVLNAGHRRIVLIVDPDNRLLGVIADSDIRRALLQGVSFDLPVSDIMVIHPIVAESGMSDRAMLALMQREKCYEIPVLDENGEVIDLKTIDSLVAEDQSTEVIIMAGGLGKRLAPLTDDTPKPLVPIGGRPILFILLDQLLLAGFRKITITLNYKAEMIKEAIVGIAAYSEFVNFTVEKEPLGTAGALSLLESRPSGPFLVMNADLLTKIDFRAMLQFHQAENNHVTTAAREEKYRLPVGVIKLRGTRALGIEEKPVYAYFVNAGIYVLDPSILELVPADYYDMPDLINAAISQGKEVGIFPVHEYWLDVGTPDKLRLARQDSAFFRDWND